MPYVPPGPGGMPAGYGGPYSPGYNPNVAVPTTQAAATPGPVDIEPGAWIQIEEERLALEKYIADLQGQIDRETNKIRREELQGQLDVAYAELDQKRRETELALATSPIDFVAYEQYKRDLESEGGAQQAAYEAEIAAAAAAAGVTPEEVMAAWEEQGRPPGIWSERPGYGPVGEVHTDAEINAMLAEMTGVDYGRTSGEFGARVPTTQQFSRSGFGEMSQDEMAVLASFLRAGVGEEDVSIDPAEYYREMEEGFVPTMREAGPTRYKF